MSKTSVACFVVLRMTVAAGVAVVPTKVFAHCDTMGGPVVVAAKKALATGNVELVLPWVAKEDEKQIREVFEHTMQVRKLGGEAEHLADQFFFETVVRIHRASEGEPFTGLKPAGTDVGPVVPAGDKALETGSADALIKLIVEVVQAGLKERFSEAKERKAHSADSVEAGRAYVHAYVEFLHYAEKLYDAAKGLAAHGHGEAKAEHAPAHEH